MSVMPLAQLRVVVRSVGFGGTVESPGPGWTHQPDWSGLRGQQATPPCIWRWTSDAPNGVMGSLCLPTMDEFAPTAESANDMASP